MPVLRMQTDVVRETATQLTQKANLLEAEMNVLKQSAQQLMWGWSGGGSDMFDSEISVLLNQLGQLSAAGVELAVRLEEEVVQWEETAAYFGDGGNNSSPTSAIRGKHELNNWGDVFELIRDEKDKDPIKIIQIGPNDYMVLIDGTNGWDNEHNWTSAGLSGLGFETEFTRSLQEAIDKTLGSKGNINLHLAGYSQGGIEANNLANNQEFLEKYNIKSVTTFGSPMSARPQEGVMYNRFEAEGDIVPDLQFYNHGSADDLLTLPTGYISLLKDTYAEPARSIAQAAANGDIVATINGAHGRYGDEYIQTPLNIQIEDGYPIELSVDYDSRPNEVSETGQRLQLVTGALVLKPVDNLVRTSTEALFDNGLWRSGEEMGLLPDIYSEVDRRLDNANSSVLQGVGFAGDTLQSGAQVVGDTLQSGAQAVGDTLQSGAQAVGDTLQSGAKAVGDIVNPF